MSDNTNTLSPAADNLARRLINRCRQQFQYVGRNLDDSRSVVGELRRAVAAAAADQHALMPGEVSQVITELCSHLDAASERLVRIANCCRLPSPTTLARWPTGLPNSPPNAAPRGAV
jgi:hypothetical protein